MRLVARISAPVLVLGALTFARPLHAEDADQIFEQGTAALEAGKPDVALRAFEAVWKTRKTHDVAANLAQAELQLGKHRDAAEHLAFALRSFPVSGKASVRKQIEDLLATEKTHVASLHVRVSADKADVRVSGKPVGVAPITDELYADPGAVTVEATLDGYESASQTFEMKAGESRDVELVVQAKPPERSMVAPAIAFGVGGAGLLMGAIAGAVAAAQTSDLQKVCGAALVCPESARSQADSARTAARVSTGGLVLAGVGAAVGVTVLLIAGRPKAPAQASLTIGPSFVGVKGAF